MTSEDYLRGVSYELRDLPWGQRRELISELRDHLDELPAGTDLPSRLGTPAEYAADLRSAAGLESRRGLVPFLRARRPRNLILAVLALAAIGLAIGAVAWVDSYQPLGFANGYQFPAGAKGATGIDGQSVVFRKGRPFVFGIEVRNSGRYAVRLLGVPYSTPNPWTARLTMSTPNYRGGVTKPYGRFRPFDLKPRQSVFLFLKGVYACHTGMGAGTSATYDSFPVRYRFLWKTATTDIPLPEDLAFVFPKGCPPAVPPTP